MPAKAKAPYRELCIKSPGSAWLAQAKLPFVPGECSYAPSLRLVYTLPGPPEPVVVMAVRGVLQCGVLLAATALQPQQEQQQQPGQPASTAVQEPESRSSSSSLLEQWLTLKSPPLWMAALELGLWNYLATASQVLTPYTLYNSRSLCSCATLVVSLQLLIHVLRHVCQHSVARSGYRARICSDHPPLRPFPGSTSSTVLAACRRLGWS